MLFDVCLGPAHAGFVLLGATSSVDAHENGILPCLVYEKTFPCTMRLASFSFSLLCLWHYRYGADASSEGVQRDLLPIIEGSVVSTKHGNVSTDHMLFICSGAFHQAKPSDMLAEMQGRLPVRVELKGLT